MMVKRRCQGPITVSMIALTRCGFPHFLSTTCAVSQQNFGFLTSASPQYHSHQLYLNFGSTVHLVRTSRARSTDSPSARSPDAQLPSPRVNIQHLQGMARAHSLSTHPLLYKDLTMHYKSMGNCHRVKQISSLPSANQVAQSFDAKAGTLPALTVSDGLAGMIPSISNSSNLCQ